MIKLKSAIATALVVLSPFFASASFASSWAISNPTGSAYVASGTTHLKGGTTATIGTTVPCNADFTLSLSSGVATVTGASFSSATVTACAAIVSSGFPWATTTTAIPSSTSVSVKISGISVKINGVTCTGSVTGTMTNANLNGGFATNGFTFPSTTLTGGCKVASTTSLNDNGPATPLPALNQVVQWTP